MPPWTPQRGSRTKRVSVARFPAQGCTQALRDIELSRIGVATAVSAASNPRRRKAEGAADRPLLAVDRWLESGKEDAPQSHQMGRGQVLDLTEFRGPLLPASEAPRACWERH